jgi:hypothetical protein
MHSCLTTVANLWDEGRGTARRPSGIEIVTLIPVGYSEGRLENFPPVKRIPVSEKIHCDQ